MDMQIISGIVIFGAYIVGFFFGSKGKLILQGEIKSLQTRLSSEIALVKELKRIAFDKKK